MISKAGQRAWESVGQLFFHLLDAGRYQNSDAIHEVIGRILLVRNHGLRLADFFWPSQRDVVQFGGQAGRAFGGGVLCAGLSGALALDEVCVSRCWRPAGIEFNFHTVPFLVLAGSLPLNMCHSPQVSAAQRRTLISSSSARQGGRPVGDVNKGQSSDGASAPSETHSPSLKPARCPYWSKRRAVCGVAFACANIAVPAWTRML